jgi:hypothetical protein
VDAVDLAFGAVHEVGEVAGCLNCYSESELAVLSGDAWLIPDELVRLFAQEGQDHWQRDQYGPLWRRLAPRIVRLVPVHDGTVDVGLLLRGLGPLGCGLDQWPAGQRAALLEALGCAVDVALVDGRPADDVVELLGAVSHVDHDLAPWTRRLDTLQGPRADAGLVRLAAHWAVNVLWGEYLSWWWYPDDQLALASRWLCSAAVYDRLTRFAAAHPRCKNARDALTAIDKLRIDGIPPWLYPAAGIEAARASGIHLLPQ